MFPSTVLGLQALEFHECFVNNSLAELKGRKSKTLKSHTVARIAFSFHPPQVYSLQQRPCLCVPDQIAPRLSTSGELCPVSAGVGTDKRLVLTLGNWLLLANLVSFGTNAPKRICHLREHHFHHPEIHRVKGPFSKDGDIISRESEEMPAAYRHLKMWPLSRFVICSERKSQNSPRWELFLTTKIKGDGKTERLEMWACYRQNMTAAWIRRDSSASFPGGFKVPSVPWLLRSFCQLHREHLHSCLTQSLIPGIPL